MKKDETRSEEYICYECGAKMEKVDEEVVVCPNCQHSVDIEDYVFEKETYEEIYGGNHNIHCIGCDGPWPVCATTCKLFNR